MTQQAKGNEIKSHLTSWLLTNNKVYHPLQVQYTTGSCASSFKSASTNIMRILVPTIDMPLSKSVSQQIAAYSVMKDYAYYPCTVHDVERWCNIMWEADLKVKVIDVIEDAGVLIELDQFYKEKGTIKMAVVEIFRAVYSPLIRPGFDYVLALYDKGVPAKIAIQTGLLQATGSGIDSYQNAFGGGTDRVAYKNAIERINAGRCSGDIHGSLTYRSDSLSKQVKQAGVFYRAGALDEYVKLMLEVHEKSMVK